MDDDTNSVNIRGPALGLMRIAQRAFKRHISKEPPLVSFLPPEVLKVQLKPLPTDHLRLRRAAHPWQDPSDGAIIEHDLPDARDQYSADNRFWLLHVYPEESDDLNPPTACKNYYARANSIIDAAIWFVRSHPTMQHKEVIRLCRVLDEIKNMFQYNCHQLVQKAFGEESREVHHYNLRKLPKEKLEKLTTAVEKRISEQVIASVINNIPLTEESEKPSVKKKMLRSLEISFLRTLGRPRIGTVFQLEGQQCISTHIPIAYFTEQQKDMIAYEMPPSAKNHDHSLVISPPVSEGNLADIKNDVFSPSLYDIPTDAQQTKSYQDNRGHGLRNFGLNRFYVNGKLLFTAVQFSGLPPPGVRARQRKDHKEKLRLERIYKGFLNAQQLLACLHVEMGEQPIKFAYMQLMSGARNEVINGIGVKALSLKNVVLKGQDTEPGDNEEELLTDTDFIFDLLRAELQQTESKDTVTYMNMGVNQLNTRKLEGNAQKMINARGFYEYCRHMDQYILQLKLEDNVTPVLLELVKKNIPVLGTIGQIENTKKELDALCQEYLEGLKKYCAPDEDNKPSFEELSQKKIEINEKKKALQNYYNEYSKHRRTVLSDKPEADLKHLELEITRLTSKLRDNLRIEQPSATELEKRHQLNMIISYYKAQKIFYQQTYFRKPPHNKLSRVYEFQTHYFMTMHDSGHKVATGCKDNIDRGAMMEMHLQDAYFCEEVYGSRHIELFDHPQKKRAKRLKRFHNAGARAITLAEQKPGAAGGAYSAGSYFARPFQNSKGLIDYSKTACLSKMFHGVYTVKLNGQHLRNSNEKTSAIINPALAEVIGDTPIDEKHVKFLNQRVIAPTRLSGVLPRNFYDHIPAHKSEDVKSNEKIIIEWYQNLWSISPFNKELNAQLEKLRNAYAANKNLVYDTTDIELFFAKQKFQLFGKHEKLPEVNERIIYVALALKKVSDILEQFRVTKTFFNGWHAFFDATLILEYRERIRGEKQEDDDATVDLFEPTRHTAITDALRHQQQALIELQLQLETLTPLRTERKKAPYLTVTLTQSKKKLFSHDINFGSIYYKHHYNKLFIVQDPITNQKVCRELIDRGLSIARLIAPDSNAFLIGKTKSAKHESCWTQIQENIEYAEKSLESLLRSDLSESSYSSTENLL